MDNKTAEYLAEITRQQFAHRIGESVVNPIKAEPFYNFFASLKIPSEADSSLVLGPHKRVYDFPKQYMQICKIRELPLRATLEIYPRGVIVTGNLEKAIRLVRSSKKPPLAERLRQGLLEKRRASGHDSFDSADAYMQLLRDENFANMLLEYAQAAGPYLGYIRIDFSHLVPKKGPGWLDDADIAWTKVLPIITIPGISAEHLRMMEERERQLLNLEEGESKKNPAP